jgi:hypothetical protein
LKKVEQKEKIENQKLWNSCFNIIEEARFVRLAERALNGENIN